MSYIISREETSRIWKYIAIFVDIPSSQIYFILWVMKNAKWIVFCRHSKLGSFAQFIKGSILNVENDPSQTDKNNNSH